jgi:hypothetical protein
LVVTPNYKESPAFAVAEDLVEKIYEAKLAQNSSTRRRDVPAKDFAMLTLLCHLGIIKEHRGMEGLEKIAVQIPFREQQVQAFRNEWLHNETEWWFTRRNLEWIRDGLQLIGFLSKPKDDARLHRNHIKGQSLESGFLELMRTRLFDLKSDFPLEARQHSIALAIGGLDEKLSDDGNPMLKRFREVLRSYNEVAKDFYIQIDGYNYPMTLRAPMHTPMGQLVKGRLKWGVRIYADPASSIEIPDTKRATYQFFGEDVRLDASRFVHPRGELVEIDIKASHLGIIKHMACDDKSPWKGDPYDNAITQSFPWLQSEDVKLIRKEMKFLCGILGVTTTGQRGACATYTRILRKRTPEGGSPKGSTSIREQEIRDLLRITNKKTSIASVLWKAFFKTMPEKMQAYMKKHKNNLHIMVQGIEGQIMLDVIYDVGRWTLPIVMHDGILVMKADRNIAVKALQDAYRKHTKGGEVVFTEKPQIFTRPN